MTGGGFNSSELTVSVEGAELAGTLLLPQQAPYKGSVLLLSGSGPQDRDESVTDEVRPFKVLAEALAGAGYAVYRWDDRGVGQSTGDYLAASPKLLLDDVTRIMTGLGRHTSCPRHLLLGHSQGALIAAQAAASEQVAGLVLMGCMGLPGHEGLLEQHRLLGLDMGLAEDELQASLVIKSALLKRLAREHPGSTEELRNDLAGILLNGEEALLDQEESELVETMLDELMEWECQFLATVDLSRDLLSLRQDLPVLAVTGDADLQAEASCNLPAIGQACRTAGIRNAEQVIVPGHNHLLQASSDGNPDHWAQLGEPFAPEAQRVIIDWLDRQGPWL